MDFFVSPAGVIRAIYSDNVEFERLGQITIERASHVEPDTTGYWQLHIIDGPTLGPFKKRSDAIAAEIDWLTQHRLVQAG